MKRFATIITTAVIIAAFFQSCTMEGTSTTPVSSYSVYVKETSSQGYFVTDDSLRICPTNSIGDELVNGDRVTIVWNYDATQAGASTMNVEVTGYYGMALASPIKSDKPDTLGNLGADLVVLSDGSAGLWKSGGVYGAAAMINIAFEYLCSESTYDHEVYLSYTSDPIDENDYFHFKFSHYSETDLNPYTSSSTIFSFTLPSKAYASDVKGVVITFDGLTEAGGQTSYRHTYKTQKTEIL